MTAWIQADLPKADGVFQRMLVTPVVACRLGQSCAGHVGNGSMAHGAVAQEAATSLKWRAMRACSRTTVGFSSISPPKMNNQERSVYDLIVATPLTKMMKTSVPRSRPAPLMTNTGR